MKNLALSDLGVQELTSQEERETNGGVVVSAIVGGIFILACYTALGIAMWRKRRRRRR